MEGGIMHVEAGGTMAAEGHCLSTVVSSLFPWKRHLPRRTSSSSILVEEENKYKCNFKYGKARCLSSYYSIFVARLAIMVMLAILIGLLTILTWHFTTVYTTKSIKNLAKDLRYELLQRPVLRMWNILNSTVEVTIAQVKLSEYVIGTFKTPINHDQQLQLNEDMRHITWALFASRKALNAITISYYNGHVLAFHRDHKNNNTFYIFNEPANISSSSSLHNDVPISPVPTWSDISPSTSHSAIWYREPLDPITGEKKGSTEQIPPDDLIDIAGISEIHDGAASWHVTVSKFTDSPLLSSALPVRHPSEGSIVAVVGVTTAFSSAGQLMRELVNFHTGYMYLTSQEGYLLATSTTTPLLRNEMGGPKLMMALESDDPIIRAGAEWLQKEYGNAPFNKEVHVESVMLGEQRYYIDSFFLNLKRLPLVGVIIIPRSYVMGKVDRRGYATLVILISASICILVIGCICILILTSGVSKEMKLRAELISHLDARRRAEASSNYKSQFLANMSHELRTPMAAVIGLLDILICDECLSSEQISTISQIRRCSIALLRLLNNILDLSKVESGKLVLEEAEFDLGRELEGLVDMFSVQCIDHNVEIVLDLDDDMPRIVRGDSARVVQIFANLISNSMKFTSSGHITLRGWCQNSLATPLTHGQFIYGKDLWYSKNLKSLQPEKRSSHDDKKIILWFEVEDTGCGIDSSKWELVFESFEQADPSTTRTYGGTGLGLCIVRTLVNKMGGEIKVIQKEGPGTLMRLFLVFGTCSEISGHLSQKIHVGLDKEKLMVLLALDGSMSRLTMSRWLKENGVQVCETSDWSQMIKTLAKFEECDHHVARETLTTTQSEDGLDYRALIEKCNSKECPENETYNNDNCILVSDFDNHSLKTLNVIVILDIRLLDLTTNAWIGQLFYLNKYQQRLKFAWLLNHDTPTNVKLELRRTGHFVMVNRPLYKSKLNRMLATITGEFRVEQEKSNISSQSSELQVNSTCLCIDSTRHSAQVGWSEIEVAEDSVDNMTQRHHFQNIPESIYFSRHDSFTNVIEKTVVFPYPTKSFTGSVSSSECLRKSKYNVMKDKIESSKMCVVNEVTHKTIYNNKACCESCDESNSIYPAFESKTWEKDLLRSTRQSGVLAESSLCKQADNYVLDLQQEAGQETTLSCQNQSTEVSVMKEKDTSLNVPELSGTSLTKENGDPSMIQTSIDEGLDGINDFIIPEMSNNQPFCIPPSKGICKQNALEGIRILLAEDTPVLQRVATIMLEKMGASVVAVGDGLQAVDALKCMYKLDGWGRVSEREKTTESRSMFSFQESPVFDLILMDCQMPKLDGYEATRTIRRVEERTHSHIPIVALTAHAMSSDEAKCLEVGMDAYLTKPIDYKRMVSTILSLTKRKT